MTTQAICYECSGPITDPHADCPHCGEVPTTTCWHCSRAIVVTPEGATCEPCEADRIEIERQDRAREAYEDWCERRGDEMRGGR